MEKYRYNYNWFLNSEIFKHITDYLDNEKENNILEIGCFEGLSSVYFADNLLNHEASSMICVDPFLSIHGNDHENLLKNNVEENFDFNINTCNNSNKINIQKVTSDEFFKNNDKYFNFIYIDGCHDPNFIIRDMKNSFKFLKKNGIMWMDDYLGGDGIKIKTMMNTFLKEYKGQYHLIHMGYQLAIKKY